MNPGAGQRWKQPSGPAELNAMLGEVSGLDTGAAAGYLAASRLLLEASAAPDVPADLRARVLSEHGNALRASGHFAQAIDALQQAVALAQPLPAGSGKYELLGHAHLRMAIVHDAMDSISAAFEQLQLASDQFEAMLDDAGLNRVQMVRGALYSRIDDFAHSEDCFRRSLEYYRRTGDRERIGSALSNLCMVLRRMGRSKEAIAAGREAVSLAGSKLLRAVARGNLATALADDGQLDEAQALATEVLTLTEELGNPDHHSKYKRALADILRRQGDLHGARDLALRALALADEHGCRRNAIICRGLLSEIHRDLGEFEQAYGYLAEFHRDMLAANRRKAVSQLEVQKWRMELEGARVQAELERERRRHLAESLAELNDMHEQLAAHAVQLEQSNHSDPLTDLANRRYFDERLEREAERSKDFDEGVSLVMLDIDEFKNINDRWGHPVGDDVLRQTARLLKKGVRRSDLCARLGGEEFAVLLTSDVQPDELWRLAEQLRKAIQDHNWDELAPGLRVTVSIGAASLTEVGHEPLRLLSLADSRLYEAKRTGRNRVVTGPPLETQTL